MVEEELAAHDIKGNVMGSPCEEKESGRVIKTSASAYKTMISTMTREMSLVVGQLTVIEGVHATAQSQLVSTKDTDEYSKKRRGEPPAKRVTDEVDLLASVVVGPERHTTEEEWPRDGLRGVWVRASQGVVVVEHGTLELNPLPEKA